MESKDQVNEPTVSYGEPILRLDQLDLSKRYSYADYFKWKFQERVELIKGYIYKMTPAPGLTHQSIPFRIGLQLGTYFKEEECKVLAAPFDVRLPDSKKEIADKEVFTVVQPDLCVICDQEKLDERGCIGAPDLVVEILSPGNTKKEMGLKFDLYEENGVREYWIVDPGEKVVYVYVLEKGKFVGLKPFIEDSEMVSTIFPELKFQLKDVFK